MAPPTKSAWRTHVLAARRGVAPGVRQAEATLLREHLADAVNIADTVAAYVPVGTEPGSIAILDNLLGQSITVLLPVVCTADDDSPLPLRWGRYTGADSLARAGHGLWEPIGRTGGPQTLAAAQLIAVPALAVDHRGVRLGRGAGYYDRSLPYRAPLTRLAAVVRDTELVDTLPADPHDVAMTHALTPGRGWVPLAGGQQSGNTDSPLGT